MTQVIMDHPGSECFGTRLAPKNRWCRRLVGKGSRAYHSLSMAKKRRSHIQSRVRGQLYSPTPMKPITQDTTCSTLLIQHFGRADCFLAPIFRLKELPSLKKPVVPLRQMNFMETNWVLVERWLAVQR